jgi:DNA-directed RNA polymerase sigma subunit (sigma70/sigma32)
MFDKCYSKNKESKVVQEMNDREKHSELWNTINELLDPFSRKVFQYKYNYDFQKIRSNLEISKMLGFSEEHIRQILKKSNEKIRQNQSFYANGKYLITSLS